MKTTAGIGLIALFMGMLAFADPPSIDRMNLKQLRELATQQQKRIADLERENESMRSQIKGLGAVPAVPPSTQPSAYFSRKPLRRIQPEKSRDLKLSPPIEVLLLDLKEIGRDVSSDVIRRVYHAEMDIVNTSSTTLKTVEIVIFAQASYPCTLDRPLKETSTFGPFRVSIPVLGPQEHYALTYDLCGSDIVTPERFTVMVENAVAVP